MKVSVLLSSIPLNEDVIKWESRFIGEMIEMGLRVMNKKAREFIQKNGLPCFDSQNEF